MKEFELTKKMVTMGGAFYPTGYAFIMFPSEEIAQQAADGLDAGTKGVMLLSPQTILREIGRVDGESDTSVALPSVGTEGATVGKYVHLARQGHHALMIPVGSREDTERVMAVVRQLPFSYGQKYHMLAIEDLE